MPEPVPADLDRRRLTQSLLTAVALAAAPDATRRLWAQSVAAGPRFAGTARATLESLADSVLPGELGDTGTRAVVAAFVAWIAEYRAGADLGHAYFGAPIRVAGDSAAPRETSPPRPTFPTAPTIRWARYDTDLANLDQAARRQHRKAFGDLTREARAALVREVVDAASTRRLPSRPDGGHVAVDLLAFWCATADATDLCYRARIGREACRGLAGSERKPAPLSE